MKAKVKNTGEVFKVLYLDSESILIKCGNEVKTLHLHEVDLIPESTDDKQKKEIDWEERRYELAKEAMNGILASPVLFESYQNNYSLTLAVTRSIDIADVMINKLKKGRKE